MASPRSAASSGYRSRTASMLPSNAERPRWIATRPGAASSVRIASSTGRGYPRAAATSTASPLPPSSRITAAAHAPSTSSAVDVRTAAIAPAVWLAGELRDQVLDLLGAAAPGHLALVELRALQGDRRLVADRAGEAALGPVQGAFVGEDERHHPEHSVLHHVGDRDARPGDPVEQEGAAWVPAPPLVVRRDPLHRAAGERGAHRHVGVDRDLVEPPGGGRGEDAARRDQTQDVAVDEIGARPDRAERVHRRVERARGDLLDRDGLAQRVRDGLEP